MKCIKKYNATCGPYHDDLVRKLNETLTRAIGYVDKVQ